MKLFNMYLHIMICCNNFPSHVHIMYKFIRTYIKFYTILFDIATTHLLFVGVIHLQTYFSLLKFNERIIFFFVLTGLRDAIVSRYSVFNIFGSHKIQKKTA